MKLVIEYINGRPFIQTGDIETLCKHITLQAKHTPDVIRRIRIIPIVKSNKTERNEEKGVHNGK